MDGFRVTICLADFLIIDSVFFFFLSPMLKSDIGNDIFIFRVKLPESVLHRMWKHYTFGELLMMISMLCAIKAYKTENL